MTATSDFATFAERAATGNLIPIYREVMADLDTPVSAFMKLGGERFGFLLESVEGGERWARYSFIGGTPTVVIRCRDGVVTATADGTTLTLEHDGNPLSAVRDHLAQYRAVAVPGLPPFVGGAVGYVAYDMVRFFDDVPIGPAAESGHPGGGPDRDPDPGPDMDDFCFLVTDRMVIFDAARQVIQIVVNVATGDGDLAAAYQEGIATIDAMAAQLDAPLDRERGTTTPADPVANSEGSREITSNVTQGEFESMVERAKEYIRAGDIFQVVLSQRFHTTLGCTPLDLYRALRRINPSPYMYYLALDDAFVVGASPELLVRTQGDQVAVRPIAGTRPRGDTPETDRALETELLEDPKERAEHLMLVDLGRNDVGRVAATGTVSVDEFMGVERYSHVMHLVSHVTGTLRPGQDAYDVLAACFPAGTLSGAPKIRAMEIIHELETCRRGPYGGAVGYFGFDGNSDMAINIRTVLVRNGSAYFQAGAGIVADSDPTREFEETRSKAGAMARAIETARDAGAQ